MCMSVHVEHLDWLADSPRYTQRFDMHVGDLCCYMTVSRVADIERLHHSTVRDLDKLYMRRQVELAGMPTPRAIVVDEISIRKGHNNRVIVSDLDQFYTFIGKTKCKRIKLAAMDMWKAFRNSTLKNAPQALIIYDKFLSCITYPMRLSFYLESALRRLVSIALFILSDQNM